MRREYRVSWKREGGTMRYAIVQSEQVAERVAKRQETAHDDMTQWQQDGSPLNVPAPLNWGPVIHSRRVGPWE